MSILNYFRRKNNTFPEPNGTLSNLIPSLTIAAANKEMSNLVHTMQCSQPKKRLRIMNKNNVYSPQLRAEMGEVALKLDATTASRKYLAKLSMRINENTMQGLKSVCLREATEET